MYLHPHAAPMISPLPPQHRGVVDGASGSGQCQEPPQWQSCTPPDAEANARLQAQLQAQLQAPSLVQSALAQNERLIDENERAMEHIASEVRGAPCPT